MQSTMLDVTGHGCVLGHVAYFLGCADAGAGAAARDDCIRQHTVSTASQCRPCCVPRQPGDANAAGDTGAQATCRATSAISVMLQLLEPRSQAAFQHVVGKHYWRLWGPTHAAGLLGSQPCNVIRGACMATRPRVASLPSNCSQIAVAHWHCAVNSSVVGGSWQTF